MDHTLVDLAGYNAWANQLYRDYFAIIEYNKLDFKTPYGTMKELLIHVVVVIDLCLDRIDEKIIEPMRSIKDFTTWKYLSWAWNQADQHFIKSTLAHEDEDKIIFYISLDNQPCHMTIRELYIEASNHQIYHRGQVATLMRINGFSPLPSTDMDDYVFNKKNYQL